MDLYYDCEVCGTKVTVNEIAMPQLELTLNLLKKQHTHPWSLLQEYYREESRRYGGSTTGEAV